MTDQPNGFERFRRRPAVRRFSAFFGASAIGLAIDLGLFTLLSTAGTAPWLANAISATLSITAVYLLATRHSFAVKPRVSTYVAFFAWYAGSIALFSFLIDIATDLSGLPSIAWKLASVPVSFALNYGFSTVLFRRRT